MHYLLVLSIASTVIWSIFYGSLRKLFQDRSPEFSNRLVTLFHGAIMASFGSSQCILNGWAFYNYNESTSITQAALLLISLGYFMFDLIWCLYYQTETSLMIAHHVYSCFAMSRMLVKGHSANQAVCALGLMECTNPLLQTRWFIRTLGYQKTGVFTCVEWSFVAIFISMRLVLGTLICYEVLTGSQDWEFKLLAVLIYIVSWAFMINMYMYMRKKYDKSNNMQLEYTETENDRSGVDNADRGS